MKPDWNRIIIAIGIFISVIAGIILGSYLGLQRPETSLLPEIGASSQVTAEVNNYLDTKIVSSDRKVAVYIPANAIENDGYIVLTSLAPNTFTDPNGEWNRPIVVNLDLYDPFGKLVSEPIITRILDICFLLSEEESAGFQKNRENYYIQYYEEKKSENSWIKISYSSKTDSKQLCGEINHLTLISLAIRGEVGIPTPSDGLYRFPVK